MRMLARRFAFAGTLGSAAGRAVRCALVLSALALPASELHSRAVADAVLSAVVVDDDSGHPIEGVEVVIVGGKPPRVVTGTTGAITVRLADGGTVVMWLRRLGYRPLSVTIPVTAGETARVSIALTRLPRDLDTVKVVAAERRPFSPRLAGFEFRRTGGLGKFITRDDIERRSPWATGDLLQGIAFLRVVDNGKKVVSARQAFADVVAGTGCVMPILIDGVLQPGMRLDMIAPQNIHGIETYAGPATTPIDLAVKARNVQCGLIAVWTREGGDFQQSSR